MTFKNYIIIRSKIVVTNKIVRDFYVVQILIYQTIFFLISVFNFIKMSFKIPL